jgi:hypothetical protein
MHTITKSWARFTGIEANCWENNDKNSIFFGGNGYVGKFYGVYSDNGNNISASAQQAYNYFESPGQLKRFTMVRPILQVSNGLPSVLVGINVDFDPQNNLGAIGYNPSSQLAGVWDTAKWDQNNWSGGLIIVKVWQGVTGIGYAASLVIKVVSQTIETHWASSDYVFEKGGVL